MARRPLPTTGAQGQPISARQAQRIRAKTEDRLRNEAHVLRTRARGEVAAGNVRYAGNPDEIVGRRAVDPGPSLATKPTQEYPQVPGLAWRDGRNPVRSMNAGREKIGNDRITRGNANTVNRLAQTSVEAEPERAERTARVNRYGTQMAHGKLSARQASRLQQAATNVQTFEPTRTSGNFTGVVQTGYRPKFLGVEQARADAFAARLGGKGWQQDRDIETLRIPNDARADEPVIYNHPTYGRITGRAGDVARDALRRHTGYNARLKPATMDKEASRSNNRREVEDVTDSAVRVGVGGVRPGHRRQQERGENLYAESLGARIRNRG